MPEPNQKIKEFFEQKNQKTVKKIIQTPMEKFFVFFLVLITITAVILGFLQMRSNIEKPLLIDNLQRQQGKIENKYQLTTLNADEQEAQKLKQLDSDLDGLDDYSEINYYKTSPYLEDSDSDGIWDKQEILQGSDPNCPAGQDCYGTQQTGTKEPATTSDFSYENLDINDLTNLENQLLTGETTLEQLGIDNPGLQDLFSQLDTLKSTETAQLPSDETQAAVSTLQNYTPDQIRQELIKQGMTEDVLNQIDDKTLKSIFLEVLSSYQ